MTGIVSAAWLGLAVGVALLVICLAGSALIETGRGSREDRRWLLAVGVGVFTTWLVIVAVRFLVNS